MLRQYVKQAADNVNGVRHRNVANRGSVRRVAADRDTKRDRAVHRLDGEAHVRRDRVESERAAPIEGNRDFGGEPCGKRAPRECAAQICRQGFYIQNFFSIEPGERIGQDWNSVRRRDP